MYFGKGSLSLSVGQLVSEIAASISLDPHPPRSCSLGVMARTRLGPVSATERQGFQLVLSLPLPGGHQALPCPRLQL